MNYPSPQSKQPATDWIYKDFKQARKKLVILYLLIMAGIISLFSFLLITQLNERTEVQNLPQNGHIVITEADALAEARKYFPGKEIIDTEYDFENGSLLLTASFDNDDEVKTDLFTGKSFIPAPEDGGLMEKLTDDLENIIWWIALFMFVISALASFIIAHTTLRPIAAGIEKQKRFVSDAAHELRNPLAAIHSSLEAALRDPRSYSLDTKEMFNDLLSETKRLIATSEGLLNLERQGSKTIHIETVSVEKCLDAVLVRLRGMIEEKQILITHEVGPESISIDKEDFHTILYNLIGNAIKFSHAGGNMSVTWNNKKLVISDTGIGIDERHIPHVFERFYKADQARGFAYSGSGLGLALVREIVESHGGKITAESRLHRGTTFTVSFS